MTNNYQKLSEYIRSEQEITLATEIEEEPLVTQQKKEPSVARRKKEIEKVSGQAQRGVSERKEEIKKVLKLFMDQINSSSQSKPQNILLLSQTKAHEDNCEELNKAINKLIDTEDKLSELNSQNNRYKFVETLENMVGQVLAQEGKQNLIFRSPINQKLIVFYNKQRQQLLQEVAAIYPDYKIGRIWA